MIIARLSRLSRLAVLALRAGSAALVCGASACSSPEAEVDLAQVEPSASMLGKEAQEPAPSPVALRIEQALRRLDTGKDAAGARAALESALAEPEIGADERDDATLGLSRALEALGDVEGAIRLLEQMLARHEEERRWSLEKVVTDRLHRLVTGEERKESRPLEDDPESPFSRVLARYFQPDAEGHYEVTAFAFGGSRATTERVGTFNVDVGIRALRREACPLCEERTNIHTSFSRGRAWTDIPKAGARQTNAIAIYYFDLESMKIPARYDAYLPMPSAEVVKRLERGEGVVAAKERPGSPPALLVAAPRQAQLDTVEEALAAMTSLPTEPVMVTVKPNLTRDEIQGVVRGSRSAFKACYEALLAKAPKAEGKVVLRFGVGADGLPEGVSVRTEDPALEDAGFQRCFVDAAAAMRFPATGVHGTVEYPLSLSP